MLPTAGRRRFFGRPWSDYALFLILLGPNLALLAVFTYRPLVENVQFSFYDWNLSSPTATFIGFGNYREWLSRDDTWVVVDFKTDRELDVALDVYRCQVQLYAQMVARATGAPARAVLMRI